jgi:prophage regulatory protein
VKRIIRLPVVETKTGLKHSAIYQKIAEEDFPRPVPLGSKAVGWLEAEVDEWIDRRVAERDSKRPSDGFDQQSIYLQGYS